jgi:Family of unknown function (DUF6977)
MAKRPIFIPYFEGHRLVREILVEFKWNPGFAPIQKKKNIAALHEAAKQRGFAELLEVSTKSDEKLGERLSAFNMSIELDDGTAVTLECAFQGSKVFERDGPFTDIYRRTSREAKKDNRIRSSGKIVGFRFEGFEFPSEPKTAFYDWLYARALAPHREYLERFNAYDGFTDIEFNPEKSINCQARSCALFVSLVRKDLLDHAISSPARFIETVSVDSFAQPYSDDVRQGRLF